MKEDKPNTTQKGVKEDLDVIKKFCKQHQQTLAVAESASSGALQLLFSSEEEAGLFFEGGLTLYNCEQKRRQLRIPTALCNPCNGVSKEISEKLALNICELYQSNFGLGLTGYASPFPEAGVYDLHAFGAAAHNGKVLFCEKLKSQKESPEEIREDYACILLKLFTNYLKSHPEIVQESFLSKKKGY